MSATNPIVAKAVQVEDVETVPGVGFENFEFWAVGPGQQQNKNPPLVNPKFSFSSVQFTYPFFDCCAFGIPCCCASFERDEFMPRHKLVGYDFQDSEWIAPCCCIPNTSAVEFTLSDKITVNKGNEVLTIPKTIQFFSHPQVQQTKFPRDLPEKLKNYIFGPLNSVGNKGQLMAHMIQDGISDLATLELDVSKAPDVSKNSTIDDTAAFTISYGKRGQGKFSEVEFQTGFISLAYGNNSHCCFSLCVNPCNILSRNLILPRYQVTSFGTTSSTCCFDLCPCFEKKREITLVTREKELALTCLGFVMRPKVYHIPAGNDFDKEKLTNYVYGGVLEFGPDLHVLNHMVAGGIINKISISDNVGRFLGREEMER